MDLKQINNLIAEGKITTISAMVSQLRISEIKCKNKLKDWYGIIVEKHSIYAEDPDIAKELKLMIKNGDLTNPTKYSYDNDTYRSKAAEALKESYDKFNIGNRSYYLRK